MERGNREFGACDKRGIASRVKVPFQSLDRVTTFSDRALLEKGIKLCLWKAQKGAIKEKNLH